MKRHFLLFLCLGLVGAGCAAEPEVSEEPIRVISDALAHPGIDGSLSLMAFDALAEAYQAELAAGEERASTAHFAQWLEQQDMQRDVFANTIQLRIFQEGSFELWTEGADKQPDTSDDFWKHYETEHVTTTGDLQ